MFFEDSTDVVTQVSGLTDCLKGVTDVEVTESYLLLVGCNNTALSGHHYNDPNVPVARTHFEAFGKDAGKEIYQAVTSVWYALDFYRRFFKNSGGQDKPADTKRTSFLHGVVVFEGILVVASKRDKDYRLAEVPHVMLRTIDCLTNKSLPFGSNRETIVDVIREDYLEQYLSLCQRELGLCIDHLATLVDAGWLGDDMRINSLIR